MPQEMRQHVVRKVRGGMVCLLRDQNYLKPLRCKKRETRGPLSRCNKRKVCWKVKFNRHARRLLDTL